MKFIRDFKWWILGSIGALLVIFSGATTIYSKGYTNGENVSKVALQTYENQVLKLREEVKTAQGKITQKVITEFVELEKERERIVYVNRPVIEENVPEQHLLSKGWVYAHNQTALGRPIDPVLASDNTPAMVTDVDALGTIAENNNQCIANADRLEALQKWTTEIAQTSNITRP